MINDPIYEADVSQRWSTLLIATRTMLASAIVVRPCSAYFWCLTMTRDSVRTYPVAFVALTVIATISITTHLLTFIVPSCAFILI